MSVGSVANARSAEWSVCDVSELSRYKLTKWRRLLLLRDCEVFGDKRIPVCVMCRRPHYTSALQAHHIWPKSVFPGQAYDITNGVILCLGCHQGVVHASNSFRDIAELENWRRFVPMFEAYATTGQRVEFAIGHQYRLTA